MTAMYKQTFSDYEREEWPLKPQKPGHDQRKVQSSSKTHSRKTSLAVSNRAERARPQKLTNSVAGIRTATRPRAATKSSHTTESHIPIKKRSDVTSKKNKTSHSSNRGQTKRTSVASKRSERIDRAMQKRKKRLADMERNQAINGGHAFGGQLHSSLTDVTAGENSHSPVSRLRTRVRYLHSPQKTVVGRILSVPMATFRRRIHFLVIVAGMFVGGLMLTLWLTSQSAMSAYEQDRLSNRNAILNNYVNELTKELAEGNSAPVLMEKAAGMGMVPVSDINVLQHKKQAWTVFGSERRVQGPRIIPSYGSNPPPIDKKIPPAPQQTPINPVLTNPAGYNPIPTQPTNQIPSLVAIAPSPQLPTGTFPSQSVLPIKPAGPNDMKSDMPVTGIPLFIPYSPAAQAQYIPNSPVTDPTKIWKAPAANQ